MTLNRMDPDRIDHHVGEIAEQGFTFVEDAIEPELLDTLRGTIRDVAAERETAPRGLVRSCVTRSESASRGTLDS